MSKMNGKIFPESNSIIQDQARILFKYYQEKAEIIVKEEMRIEKEIARLKTDAGDIEEKLSSFWKRLILWISFKLKKTKQELESLLNSIVDFEKQHKDIFRDYKVNKLGVAYVPVADQIKYDNKSFIVDYTGIVKDSELKLQIPRKNDLFIQTISALESLTKTAPIVEGSLETEEINTEIYSSSMQQMNLHDYFGRLERSMRTISYCLDDLDVTSVSLPLVENNSNYLSFLKEYSTNEVPEGYPVFEVFDKRKYFDDIQKFQELKKLKDSLTRQTAQFEDVLRSLMGTMANSVQTISTLKVASTDKIVSESNKTLFKILKSPYNHYSPNLEASEIERIKNETFNYGESALDYVPFKLKKSSKVKYNLFSDTWVAEDGSSTNFPFGIHQIYEEIVAPVVQNLMNETRIERLKIYNHIKDQKISYLNKWHQDTEDFYGRNRAESADLVNLMRASLSDYIAAFNTLVSLQKTVGSMNSSDGSLDSTLVKAEDISFKDKEKKSFAEEEFEKQSKEFQNVQLEFENFMESLKDDIEEKALNFEHIDYYDALLRDGNSRDLAVATDEIHLLDKRRKPLISVNPLLAKNSDIPPFPSIEGITQTHSSINLPTIVKEILKEYEQKPEMKNADAQKSEDEYQIMGNSLEYNQPEGSLPDDSDLPEVSDLVYDESVDEIHNSENTLFEETENEPSVNLVDDLQATTGEISAESIPDEMENKIINDDDI